MSKTVAYSIMLAAVLFFAVVAGFIYFRNSAGEQQPVASGNIPPLPADARMFGSWALTGCNAEGNDGPCILQLRVVNNQIQRVVFRLSVARAQNNNDVMLIQLPSNVVIARGVTVTPQGGTALTGAVRACRPTNCLAGMPLDDNFVQELSAAEAATLEFLGANGRAVSINLPMAGFGEGFAAWRMAMPAVDEPVEEIQGEAAPEAN